ncbi:MAG: hypothetical protein MK000_05360 [Anaerolineales bacterium]|nr:hypothetical protein [Anaerolineales bacterium]
MRKITGGEMAEKSLDLTKMEISELIEQIQDDLYDGLADEVAEITNELLRREMTP